MSIDISAYNNIEEIDLDGSGIMKMMIMMSRVITIFYFHFNYI